MRKLSVFIFMVSAALIQAQDWQLRDIGVGIIVDDGKYDQELKIVRRATEWNLRELYENGALAGKLEGNQVFATWICGPPVSAFLNGSGLPAWLYRYTVTYPDGTTFASGTANFYAPGFAWFGFNPGKYLEGDFRIEFSLVNRDTQEVRFAGMTEFRGISGRDQQTEAKPFQVFDKGVGLVIRDGDYDKTLKIDRRGDRWNLRQLYDAGAFSNRYDGTPGFAAWLCGLDTVAYSDANGIPVYMYKVRLTYPDGTVREEGPSYFYRPGFAVFAINPGSSTGGKWKVEFLIVRRASNEVVQIETMEFETVFE